MSEKKEAPVFTNPEIEALYAYGWDFPEAKIREIVALPRQTVIADLEKVIDDSILRFDNFQDIEWDESKYNFLANAIWLLCELKSEESLPKLLEVLRQDNDALDFWFSDMVHEMLPMNVWYLGINQIDKLFSFLREPQDDWSPRAVVSTALMHIALYNEEKKPEIIEQYKLLFEFYIKHKDNPKITDYEVIGGVITDVFYLNIPELMPSIKYLYDENLVALGIAGTWESYEKDFYDTKTEKTPTFKQQSMAEFYAEILEITTEHEKKQEEWREEHAKRQAKENEAYAKRQAIEDENRAKQEAKQAEYPKPQSSFAGVKHTPSPSSHGSPTMDFKKLMQNRDTPRNAPCPCGSGRKYKNCHGK